MRGDTTNEQHFIIALCVVTALVLGGVLCAVIRTLHST